MDRRVQELVSSNIKSLREKKGISQSELSRAADYSRTYVGQIERKEKDPSLKALIRIAEVLDVPVLSLFHNYLPDNESSFEPDATTRLMKCLSIQKDSPLVEDVHNFDDQMKAVYDSEGRVLDFTQGVFEFLNKPIEDVIGQYVWEIDIFGENQKDAKWFKTKINDLQSDDVVFRRNIKFHPDDNGAREFEVSLFRSYYPEVSEHLVTAKGVPVDKIVTNEQ